MPKKQLPRFVIYQPNQKEFYICFEVAKKFFRWLSNYPPTLDIRFTREVKRVADIPANKIPRKGIFDQGTYAITRTDTKEVAEKKLIDGINGKSFPFILNGRKLNGRFSFKTTTTGTVIQKYKDKYAVEEDILSGDLSRTISAMIPNYDETKITLDYPKKGKSNKTRDLETEQPLEEVTADKTIGNTEYHFSFYTSDDEPDICLVTSADGKVLVLTREQDGWVLVPLVSKSILKREPEFIEHAEKLYLGE